MSVSHNSAEIWHPVASIPVSRHFSSESVNGPKQKDFSGVGSCAGSSWEDFKMDIPSSVQISHIMSLQKWLDQVTYLLKTLRILPSQSEWGQSPPAAPSSTVTFHLLLPSSCSFSSSHTSLLAVPLTRYLPQGLCACCSDCLEHSPPRFLFSWLIS